MKRALYSSAAATVLTLGLAFAAEAKKDKASEERVEFVLPYWGEINPFYGEINPFWGEINPFYGEINPFWGEINPFWGEINPFYGEISAFWGEINPFYGEINPFWGEINSFWRDAGPEWGSIYAQWGEINPFDEGSETQYAEIAEQLNLLFESAETAFDGVMPDKDKESFFKYLQKKYDFNLDDPITLQNMNGDTRSRFFLDFYDGLMSFSKVDHVDHWMATSRWSPSLSQAAGGGDGVTVGVLDFRFDKKVGIDVKHEKGEKEKKEFTHGAAVTSLIAAPHDGEGLMGVAPDVELNIYSPFDKSGTADWKDVSKGLGELGKRDSNIINMSLGVPEWTLHPEWASVFSDKKVATGLEGALFVISAGNDGVTQTVDVDWTAVGSAENLLVVGSVGPTGEISSFSNRPGEACLIVDGVCPPDNLLMNRFLVAPGELVLVSDGEDGVTRMSGTSFAAPLVSGAAALVQGRWGWLEASDTADVLLLSAQDLGEPGVDPVYGHGLLDVDAALSPLDPQNLVYVTPDGTGSLMTVSGRTVPTASLSTLSMSAGQLSFAEPNANQVSALEPLGDTYRDFLIPLSEIVVGGATSQRASAASTENYLAERTAAPVEPRGKKDKKKKKKFHDTHEFANVVSAGGRWEVGLTAGLRDPLAPVAEGELAFQTGVAIHDRASGAELRLGVGEGAIALNRQAGFGLFSDYRPSTGGVNPVVGFASGGAYVMSGGDVNSKTSLSFGITSATDEHVYADPLTGEERPSLGGLSDYEAVAFLTGVRHSVSDQVTVHASYTHLDEATGLLGAQGSGPLSLDGGAQTNAVTLGADARLGRRFTASVSTTMAQTGSADFAESALALTESATSTAFQVSARRDGLFGDHDALRASIIQPLHVESGAIEYSATQVVDRETGELGDVTERWALGGERPLVGEMLYATPLLDGRAEISLFGRFDIAGDAVNADLANASTGLRFGLDF